MTRKKAKKRKKTPLRSSLESSSSLQDKVMDGIGAIEKPHRDYLDASIRKNFADSMDLDKAMLDGHENENRWDYLLGHAPSGDVIGLEPHSAKQDEISTVIKKKQAAKEHLRGHLKPNARVASWLWVASGRVHFADTEKARRRLDQHGIQFVGGELLARHLPRPKTRRSKKTRS